MRLLLKLVILALAGYGAKALYDRYGAQAGGLQAPAGEFVDRARHAVGEAAQQVKGSMRDTAHDVEDAASDLGDELGAATDDATTDMKSRMSATSQ